MKLLEKLHPKAQSAFLKLPEKSYMKLFSQFDFSPKLLMQKSVTIYSAATQQSFCSNTTIYLLKGHKVSKTFRLTLACRL